MPGLGNSASVSLSSSNVPRVLVILLLERMSAVFGRLETSITVGLRHRTGLAIAPDIAPEEDTRVEILVVFNVASEARRLMTLNFRAVAVVANSY